MEQKNGAATASTILGIVSLVIAVSSEELPLV